MGTARWDVQVLGLDPERASDSGNVVASVARRLGVERTQIERLIAHAPTTLVADLDEAPAKTLVQELRTLGLRVKPRPCAADTEHAAPPSMPPPPMPVADERATAPTMALPRPPMRASARAGSTLLGPSPVPSSSSSSRSPLEQLSEASLSAASGLELEDVAPPSLRVGPDSTRPPAAGPRRDSVAPGIAPRRIEPIETPTESPRVFWSALPAALLVPLRRPVVGGLIAAPVFMALAVASSILGTFSALVGVLVMSSAFVGMTLQVSHRCLWATAVGERMPASLPSGFLAEYAFPGISMVIVQGMIGALAGWGAGVARAHGVPIVAIQIGMVVFGLYGVIGFALAAANRSAMGLLDVARILRILVRAPLPVAVIALVGALVQGTAVAIAVAQFAAVAASGGEIGSMLLAVMGSTLVVSFAASYGAALTATMMGMLFWARPEVAG